MRGSFVYLKEHRLGRLLMLWTFVFGLAVLGEAAYLFNDWAGLPFIAATYLVLPWRRRDRLALITR